MRNLSDSQKINAVKELASRELARRKLLGFMRYTWRNPQEPLVEGFHTRIITERIDRAIIDWLNGKSTFLRVSVHPRAGKTDIVSRYLPAYSRGRIPDSEYMIVSYSATKAQEFGRAARSVVAGDRFKAAFPGIDISQETSAADDWSVTVNGKRTIGRVYSSGLQSGLTGSGYHIGVLDDYCAGRADAESKTIRNKTWDAFTNDFLTRRAPASITIVIATQWHIDDIHGRIERKNNPNSDEYDPSFPQFEHLSFPARAELYTGPGEYSGEYLFMERYPAEWYKSQYAQLGTYSAAALMDCNPVPRSGALINCEHVQWHNSSEEWPQDLRFFRIWDLAHTAKQRTGDDPDYTGGTLIAFKRNGKAANGEDIISVYIKDYVQFRENAAKRDEKIIQVATADGPNVRIVVESSLDSKDAADYIKAKLSGVRVVDKIICKGDKVSRFAPLEGVFESGNIHCLNGPWKKTWLDGMMRFDGTGSSHDEMIDNISAAYEYFKKGAGFAPVQVINWR
jgi:predicted phage terminase large subunit-like protein